MILLRAIFRTLFVVVLTFLSYAGVVVGRLLEPRFLPRFGLAFPATASSAPGRAGFAGLSACA